MIRRSILFSQHMFYTNKPTEKLVDRAQSTIYYIHVYLSDFPETCPPGFRLCYGSAESRLSMRLLKKVGLRQG